MLNSVKNRISSLLSRVTRLRVWLLRHDALLAEMDARVNVQMQAQSIEIERLAGMLESSAARIAQLESSGSVAMGYKEIVDLRTHAQSVELERLTTLIENCTLRVAHIENDRDVMLRHLTEQYRIVVEERDALLNERDRLLVGLQRAQRPGGLSPDSLQVHAPRLPFPDSALPAGYRPKVYVIDIGAQNLVQEEHVYQPLVKAGAAIITGFEPLQEAAEKRSADDPSLRMLNHFIGDGSSHKFHINEDDTTSSLIPADLEFLDRFDALAKMCSPVQTMEVQTSRLDDIHEIIDCDFLKIDVQGGELAVLQGAANVLAKTTVVHCEVEFSRVYKDQPLFGDIDAHMRAAGFELLDIINAGYATVKGLPRPLARSRLLWGEAVYIRTPETISGLGAEKIANAAFIAHVNYGMYDVAASLLVVLDNQAGTHYAKAYGDTLATSASPLPSH